MMGRKSDSRVVPMKPSNVGGGRGIAFRRGQHTKYTIFHFAKKG
jgi:hypothetical protein